MVTLNECMSVHLSTLWFSLYRNVPLELPHPAASPLPRFRYQCLAGDPFAMVVAGSVALGLSLILLSYFFFAPKPQQVQCSAVPGKGWGS